MNKQKEAIDDLINVLLCRYNFKTYTDTNKIMVYDQESGIYKPAESQITFECSQNEICNTPYSKSIIEMNIRGNTYVDRHNHNDCVCLKNGIIRFDKDSFEFIDHTPDILFESRVDIDYIKGAKCPVWVSTIDTMFDTNSDKLLLQEWFGYHFYPGQQLEKAMFFVGKPSTGKSTTIFVLDELLGNCCSHHQLSDFQDTGKYAEADLFGKLGNTYTDMGQKTIIDVGKFKTLTGSNDFLTARFPYERPFNFRNRAKLTFASNKLPPLSANVQGDLAFWKRVLLIQFSNQIKEVDRDIFNKLRKEMPGILNWALEGYLRLKKNNGEFTSNTDDIYATWSKSAYCSNPLQEFLEDCCIFGQDCIYSHDSFMMNYSSWCIKNHETQISQKEIRAALAQKGIFESTKMNHETSRRELVWKGLTWA